MLDDCGVCAGDNSSCTDCAGVVNGDAMLDDCGVCAGDNSSCTDCEGVVNGTAVVDDCGLCRSEQVTLYMNCNFTGTSLAFGVGSYPNIGNAGFSNDDLSSVVVPAGYQVTFYQNFNFEGTSITLIADNPCLVSDSFNDFASSLIVESICDDTPTNCSNPQNIAIGKPTQQSSTLDNNQDQFGSANAVDGNNNGNHNNNSITHTLNEQNAWWEIDLEEINNLSSVKLWNRTNCCADRLTDFHVLVSDVPFTSTDLNATINQSGVSDYHFPGTAGRETDIILDRTGRYLRVQLSGTERLQLAEVEIFGCAIECDPSNVSLGKPTQQSSTLGNNQNQFGSANAVDGNNDGDHNNNSITHTLNEQNAWWEVDLEGNYDLYTVKLWNRTNCCADRLTDFHVLVSDVPFTSTDLNATINQDGVTDYHFPGTAGRETDIILDRTGRYLRVQLSGTNRLQLAEVEIMGCEIPEATIYQNCNFSGPSVSVGIGEYPNMTSIGFNNDVLSSLQVPTGLQVTLFSNTNFGGSSINFVEDDNCLVNNSFNDVTRSIIIEPIGAIIRAIDSDLDITSVFGEKAKLQWYFYEGDKEVKQFLIKHSSSVDEEMTELAIIPSEDNSGARTYEYLHDTPTFGINYYQVIVQFEDGTENYQMIGDIKFDKKVSTVQVAPNPATDYLKVDISNYMDKSMDYFIQSIEGVIQQNGSLLSDHEDIVQLDLRNIPNGIYILYMKPENRKAIAVKFVIAKDY